MDLHYYGTPTILSPHMLVLLPPPVDFRGNNAKFFSLLKAMLLSLFILDQASTCALPVLTFFSPNSQKAFHGFLGGAACQALETVTSLVNSSYTKDGPIVHQ